MIKPQFNASQTAGSDSQVSQLTTYGLGIEGARDISRHRHDG